MTPHAHVQSATAEAAATGLRPPVPVVELRGLVKDLNGVRALNGLDLVVPAGATTVILGASGSGKTVMVKHIVGLLHPDRGVVRVQGRNVAMLTEAQLNALRQHISVQFQGSLPYACALFDSYNVRDNVAFGLHHRTDLPEEEIDAIVADYIARVGLTAHADKMPAQLSAGMRKRAALARALALESRLVVIDDFESGIDGVRLAHLCNLVREVQARTLATMIITTHDMETARRISDYTAVVHEGRVVASGPTDQVLEGNEPVVRQLMRGERTGPITMRDVGVDRTEEYMQLYGRQYGMNQWSYAAVLLMAIISVAFYFLLVRDSAF